MGYIRDSFTNSSVIYLVTISSTEWKINPWEEPCWRSSEQTQKRKLWIKGERINQVCSYFTGHRGSCINTLWWCLQGKLEESHMELAVKNRDLTKVILNWVMIDFSPRNRVGYICVFLHGICCLFHIEKHPAGKAEGHSLWKSQNYRGIPVLSPFWTCEIMVWLFSDGVLLSANASEGPAVRVDETTRALTESTLQVNSTDAALRRSVVSFVGKFSRYLWKAAKTNHCLCSKSGVFKLVYGEV